MKLKPYKDMLALTKEKLDEALAPIRARQVKSKAELAMAEVEANILTLETAIQEMCVDKNIDLVRLLDKIDEIELLERRKRKYGQVLEQLFPESKKSKAED